MTRSADNAHMTILAGETPIGTGTNREIWDRPGHPDQILKTVFLRKREKFENRSALRRRIEDIRNGPYISFRAEYRCYLNTAYRCLQLGRPIPIAEIGGMVITDRGLAQVCEKITDATGALAPTLLTLIKDGALDTDRLSLLNAFVDTLYHVNVNVPDLTSANVLLDETRNRFVLIDGYGDRTLIPVLALCKPLNQREMDRRFPKMAVTDDLRWDPQTRAFAFT